MNHINQFTSVTLFFNLKPGVAIGDATDHITKTRRRPSCRPRSARELQGEALTFRNTVRDLTILMALAVFVMYVILAILYESYVHPLTVLSTLAHRAGRRARHARTLFGEPASLYAFVGMFMLMGIVKKNGIMIVDFARHRVEAGEAADQAIHDASLDRFRPIVMTTLAAVIGAVPIALGVGADGASRRAARPGDRRRADGLPAHHALRDAGDLPLPRGVPGAGAGPHDVLPSARAPGGRRRRGPRPARSARGLAASPAGARRTTTGARA